MNSEDVRSGVPPKLMWAIVALALAGTVLPYLFNFLRTPAGFSYSWILPPYPEDSLSYLAWSRQAADGAFLFRFNYTATPHSAFLFQPFFLLCGRLAAASGLEIALVHLLVKSAGVVLFLLTLCRVLRRREFSALASTAALFLISFSSGCGAILLFLIGPEKLGALQPVDLTLVDCNIFQALLWNPLLPYALTLLLTSVDAADRGARDGGVGWIWLSGLSVGLLALIHPYEVALLGLLIPLIILTRRKTQGIPLVLRFLAASAPFALYVLGVAALQPLVARHDLIARMPSPHPLALAAGLAWPLIIAAPGLWAGRGAALRRNWPLALWALLSFFMSYLPFWFQRKLLFGVQIPLCLLAAASLDDWVPALIGSASKKRLLACAAAVIVPLAASTQFHLLAEQWKQVREDAEGFYFIAQERLEALRFLRRDADRADVVFASVPASRLIPVYVGNPVVWGHWAMSVDYAQRLEWYQGVFGSGPGSGPSDGQRDFWKTSIRYAVMDGALKDWLEKERPAWFLSGAEKVFENASVVIYARGGRSKRPAPRRARRR